MPPFTTELIGLIGGTLGGWLLKAITLHMQDRAEQHKMWMETIVAKDSSSDKAAVRVPNSDKAGQWVRRFLVVSVTASIIFLPFLLALLNKPVVVEISEPVRSHLFGLFESGGKTKFYELNSYLMISELRTIMCVICGFYFGNSSAKRS